MKILGIHKGHDSSAALVVDGRVVADVAEERFARVKHYAGLPSRAVAYCLESQRLNIRDIDVIAISTAEAVPELNFLFNFSRAQQERAGLKGAISGMYKQIRGSGVMALPSYKKKYQVNKLAEVVHVEHHLAHAASAYYTSGNMDKQLIVTMDGAGDGFSTCLWRGEGGRIYPLEKYDQGSSLGWFYSNVTEALGWWHGDGEGKTMGLAPYGDASKVAGILEGYHPEFSGGRLVKAHGFGQVGYWEERGAIEFTLADAKAIRDKILPRTCPEDLAAEAQRVLEVQAANLIFPWLEREKTNNLTCAGGIFLNVKLNQRIWETGKVANHHIFANCGDSGLAVGAALHAYFARNPGSKIPPISNVYWGKEYSNDEIEQVLKLRGIKYKRVDCASDVAASLLAEDKIVAWFQGRMESGPRALGNRSILVSANRAENKDILNARVKFREGFRPFCPSLLWEHREDYLENGRDEFYMITSFTCREGKRAAVPAAVHADNTLRPQTVMRDVNPKFWDLISKFGQLTGEYLVINTSFNLMGEPIAEHPRDAIRCFYDNGIDALVIGDFVVEK